MSVLILGGTGEARELALALHESGVTVCSSLAGAVTRPRLPVGAVRVGGFGGVTGLSEYLRTQQVQAVVDATHPFAAQISANALAACAASLVPLLRLERPGWATHPDAHHWHWVDGHGAAAEVAAGLGRRVVITTGRQHLVEMTSALAGHQVLARVVDPPPFPLPTSWRLVRARGPYTVAGERELLHEHRAEVLITKDSGGAATAAKLTAARDCAVAVVVVGRPQRPGAPEGGARPQSPPRVHEVGAALAWLREV